MSICIFCGVGPESKEDALPRWVWERLGVTGDAEIRRVSDAALIRTTRKPDFRVGAPCVACNNGWMSDLESRFRSVGGGAMLAGDVPVPIDSDSAAVVARWATKTALMVHLASAHATGGITVPPDHYPALRFGGVAAGTRVEVAGVDAAGRDILAVRPVEINVGGEPAGYAIARPGHLMSRA